MRGGCLIEGLDGSMKDDIDIRHRRQDENRVAIRRMAWGGLAVFVGVAAIGVAVERDQGKPQRLVDYALSENTAPKAVEAAGSETASPGSGSEPSEAKSQSGEHCLSGWDGANRDLVRQVKTTMREPDSFEHIDTRIYGNDKGEHGVWMTFRARNGFGGMNVEKIYARIDHDSCNALRFGEGPGI